VHNNVVLYVLYWLVQEANLALQRELSELRIASARVKYNTAPPAVQELLEQLAEQKRISKAEVMCTLCSMQHTSVMLIRYTSVEAVCFEVSVLLIQNMLAHYICRNELIKLRVLLALTAELCPLSVNDAYTLMSFVLVHCQTYADCKAESTDSPV
jgi:hypothetical protein